MSRRRALTVLALLSACASGPDAEIVDETPTAAPDPVAEAPAAELEGGVRIPTAFRGECASLASLPAPPPDLTIRQLFDCLDDASVQQLGAAYGKRVARLRTTTTTAAPGDLTTFLSTYGDRRVAEVRLRDLVLGGGGPRETRGLGVEPPEAARYASGSSKTWGLDETTCTGSCLGVSVPVVNGSRRIGYGPAWTGAEPSPGDGRRLLDEVNFGKFPDYAQNTLSNPELVASGCGPVSAVNLLEWWNIPVFQGSKQLTTFDDRAEFIADRMDTLEGLNFTDDGDLIDFVTQYPAELYAAGRIPGYPGWHAMIDDPSAWKVMLSYVARGYPVITLYASGSTSMHWALITGYSNGKLRIANANDRTPEDFYAQWHDWAALSWYADWATDLFVDPDTFVAYTGWGTSDGRPDPERFVARTFGATPAGYTASGSLYDFRYCVGAPDEIGFDSEMQPVTFWGAEPSPALPGYCMFTARHASPGTLAPSPSGSASSSRGATLTVSVAATSALSSFIAANPGVRCEFYGNATDGWHRLASHPCGDSGALKHSFTNNGQYSKLEFHVHSPDTARTTWTITTR